MKEHPTLFTVPMVRALLAGQKTQTRRILTQRNSTPGSGTWKAHDYDLSRGFPDPGFSGNGYLKAPFKHKSDPWEEDPADDTISRIRPKWQVGDLLWVKETAYISPPHFASREDSGHTDNDGAPRIVGYVADTGRNSAAEDYGVKQTPSLFMPRWASRITLEVLNVRVERLQEISEEDGVAEGIDPARVPGKYSGGVAWCAPDKHLDAICTREPGLWAHYALLWESINGPGSWDRNDWVAALTFERVQP